MKFEKGFYYVSKNDIELIDFHIQCCTVNQFYLIKKYFSKLSYDCSTYLIVCIRITTCWKITMRRSAFSEIKVKESVKFIIYELLFLKQVRQYKKHIKYRTLIIHMSFRIVIVN